MYCVSAGHFCVSVGWFHYNGPVPFILMAWKFYEYSFNLLVKKKDDKKQPTEQLLKKVKVQKKWNVNQNSFYFKKLLNNI